MTAIIIPLKQPPSPPQRQPRTLTRSVRCDGAQFDSQWVLGFLIILHRMVVAPRAVKEAPAAQNGTIREVEPEVGGEVAALTLPP